MLIKVESKKSNVKRHHKITKNFIVLIISVFFSIETNAQCAMCRAALESEGNTAKAKGINDGIVYLMVIPYVLIGLAFFAVYKIYQKKIKE